MRRMIAFLGWTYVSRVRGGHRCCSAPKLINLISKTWDRGGRHGGRQTCAGSKSRNHVVSRVETTVRVIGKGLIRTWQRRIEKAWQPELHVAQGHSLQAAGTRACAGKGSFQRHSLLPNSFPKACLQAQSSCLVNSVALTSAEVALPPGVSSVDARS